MNSIRELGGAELWFLDAARGLRDRGIPTSLVVQPDSALLGRAQAHDLPVQAIPIRFDAAPWTLSKLVRYFRRAGVTALVCNLTKDLKAAGVAGLLAGVPIRLASRESDFPLKNKGYYRWYFQRAATGVLVNSEATRRTVLASVPWLDPARVHLLYKGVDLERFRAPDDDVAARPPVVGFVGQLIERKGLSALMEAWRWVDRHPWERGASPPVTRPMLRLAGEGPWRDRLQAWRRTLIHPDQVTIEGFLEDIPAFWRDCRCAVMPSLAEGFGLAAAEAAACGLPVVASATSSLPELVQHHETGWLVPPDRPADLAEALSVLLADPERCRRLGAAGRQLVKQHFDHQHTLDRLQELTRPEASS